MWVVFSVRTALWSMACESHCIADQLSPLYAEFMCVSPSQFLLIRVLTANVSVRMPFLNLNAPNSDWVTDPKEIRPGLLAARTLLSNDDTHAAILVMNVSGVEQSFRKGHALGTVASCPLTRYVSFLIPSRFLSPTRSKIAQVRTQPQMTWLSVMMITTIGSTPILEMRLRLNVLLSTLLFQ